MRSIFSQHVARKLLLVQGLSAIVVTLIMFLVNLRAGCSALIAGLICVIANVIFASIMFRQTAARAAKEIMRNLCVGEILKLVVIVACMLISIAVFHVSIIPFLLTYFVLQVGMFFAPLACLPRGAS
jgi:ATP synthase protein I